MAILVDIEPIYQKICEMEKLARDRVIDCPASSQALQRYLTQLNERTTFKHLLFDAPTIDPVKRGKWIEVQLTKKTKEYKCSECGHWEKRKYPYCNCGADMRGE